MHLILLLGLNGDGFITLRSVGRPRAKSRNYRYELVYSLAGSHPCCRVSNINFHIVYSAVRRVVKGRCKRDGPVRHRAPGNFGQSLDRRRILVLAIHLYDHCTGT